ncbi:MAG: fibronectin type III domain-containing protein [Actinomycetes bacterium]
MAVSWVDGLSNGSAISARTVYVYSGSNLVTTKFDCVGSPCTITDLVNDSSYRVKVSDTNGAGEGSVSEFSNAVTPTAPIGAPTSPPVNVTATPGDSSATIAWSAPLSTGGSPITGYSVIASPTGATCTYIVGVSRGLSCTIDGLANGSQYSFVVIASNIAGSSGPSTPSSSVRPAGAPLKPTVPTGTPGDGRVVVTWSAPSANGAVITGYTVVATDSSDATSSTDGSICRSSAATTCTFTGLTNGDAYTFTVSATNSVGTGAVSTSSLPVIPGGLPSVPQGALARAGDQSVTAAWSPSVGNGSAVLGYTATATDVTTPLNPGAAATCSTSGATTCSLAGLINGDAYVVTVVATNAIGTSGSSAPSIRVVPAGAPTAPTDLVGRANDQSVGLSWSASSPNGSTVTGYTVTATDLSDAASLSNAATCTTSGATSCTLSGLTNGDRYSFVVVAANVVGVSQASRASTEVTPGGLPSPPLRLSARPDDHAATVLWSPPSSTNGSAITGYRVVATDLSNAGSPSNGSSCTTSGATTCTVTNLTNGDSYRFVATATNGIGRSAVSAEAPAVTPAGAPVAPRDLVASPGDTRATVTWDAVNPNGSAITGYRVTATDTTDAASLSNEATCSTSGATTCTLTGLTNGDTYRFTATATNGVGSSQASSASNSVTPGGVPSAPSGISARAGDKSATAVWSPPSSTNGSAITGYRVTATNISNAGSPSNGESCTTNGDTICTLTGLINGDSYSLTVSATNGIGTGPSSSSSSSFTPVGLPTAPTQIVTKAADSQVTVTWAAANPSGLAITGYVVTASDLTDAASSSNGAACQYVVGISIGLSCVVANLTNGDSYSFTVTATNALGNGPASEGTNPTTPGGLPAAPTNVAGRPGDASADVVWSPPAANGSPITDYTATATDLSDSESVSNGAQCTIDASDTICTITGLTNGDSYSFVVTANNAIGTGTPSVASTPVTVSRLSPNKARRSVVAPVPSAPTKVVGQPGDGLVAISWKAPTFVGSGITGYTATATDVSNQGSASSKSTCTTNGATTCTISGLTNGDAYTVKVVAVNGGGASPASASSDRITPVAPPAAPTRVIVRPGDTKATVLWSPSNANGSPVTGYDVTATDVTNPISPSNAARCSNVTLTSCSITGLTNGDSYTFTVTATNDVGTSTAAVSAPAVPSGLPSAPTGVVGQSAAGEVAISWTAAVANGSAITGYTVTATDVSNQGSATSKSTCTTNGATTCTISGLTNGDAYSFDVTATNGVGVSPASASSALVTPAGPPGAPTNVAGRPGDARVAVVWSPPNSNGSAITGYDVTAQDVTDSNSSTNGATCTTTGATICTFTGLTNGDSYTFTVTATNGVGTGASSASSAQVTPAGLPRAPTGVLAQAADTNVSISWTAAVANGSAITGYRVVATDETNAASSTNESTCTTNGATTCTISGLTNGDAYSFDVTATNGVGVSPASASSALVTPAGPPGAPTNVAGRPGDARVAVVWSPPNSNGSAITGYDVTAQDVTDSNSSTNGATCTTTGATICTFTGLTNGDSYTFTVTATNGVGTGASSASSAQVTPVHQVYNEGSPGAPTEVVATPGNRSLSISWTAADENASPILSYTATVTDLSDGGSATNLTTCQTLGATSCSVGGLVNGDAYIVVVSAANALGSGPTSLPSEPQTPLGVPSAPRSVTVRSDDGQIVVRWTKSNPNGSPITGYVVTATDLTDGVSLTNGATCITTGATSCTVTGLTNGDAYSFEVTATNDIGTSPASDASEQVVPAGTPTAPSAIVTESGDASVVVRWTASNPNGSAITGYIVTATDLSDSGSPTDGATCTTNGATTCTVTGLTNGDAYGFQVTATNDVGISTMALSTDETVPAGGPLAPTNIKGTAADGQIVARWTASNPNGSAITGYIVTVTDLTDSGSPTDGATCTTNGATTCTVTGLTNGDAYSIVVTATNGIGTSLASEASERVVPAGTPTAPSDVVVQADDARVSISWMASSGNGAAITGYIVTATDLSDSGSPTDGATCTTNGATTCTVTGLTNGDSYSFGVTATNRVGSSQSSPTSMTVTPAGLPTAPEKPTARAGDSQATLRWRPPFTNGAAITGYTATARDLTNPQSATNGATCTTTGRTTCTISGLTNGHSYKFRVTATNRVGSSAASPASSSITPAAVPSPPTGVTVRALDGSVAVTWSTSADNGSAITGYTATATDLSNQASQSSGASCQTKSATSCTVTGLTNGDAYVVALVARNDIGTSSPSDSSPSVTPAGLPDVPTNVTASSGNGQITILWSPPGSNGSAITGYRVSALDTSTGEILANVCSTTDATICVAAGLVSGDAYRFGVAASNAIGSGPISPRTAPVRFAGAPNAPKAVKATLSEKGVTVSWSAPAANGSPITGYEVTDGIGDGCTTATLDCLVTDLNEGTEYTFSVTATNAVGTSTPGAAEPIVFGSQPIASFGVGAGEKCDGCSITLSGSDLKPGSTGTVILHSDPITLGTFVVPASGKYTVTERLPANVPAGTHTILLKGTSIAGAPTTSTWFLKLGADNVILEETPGTPVAAPPWNDAAARTNSDSASSGTGGTTTINGTTYPSYNPIEHVSTAQASMLGAAVVVGTIGAGVAGMAGAGSDAGGGSGGEAPATRRGRLASASARNQRLQRSEKITRQASGAWSLPLSGALLGAMAALATRVGRFSAVGFKIIDDGVYLRASLGILSAPVYLAGLVLGAAAVINVQGAPVPPVWWLFGAIMVLGIFDAFAGLLAATVYLAGVAISGGWAHLDGIRSSGGVAAVFVMVIVAASLLRPLRRPAAASLGDWFDRTADIVVAALLAAFLTSQLVITIPALAGAELPIVDRVLALSLIAGTAIVIRYVAETLATHHLGDRLALAQGDHEPVHHHLLHVFFLMLGGAVFMLFTSAFVGWTGALWIAAGVMALQGILGRWERHLPKIRGLQWLAPIGIAKFVLVLCIGKIIASVLMSHIEDPQALIKVSVVLLALPGLLLCAARTMSEDHPKFPMTWPLRAGGTVAVLLGALVILKVIQF